MKLEPSKRALTAAYTSALLIVAALSLASYFVEARVIDGNAGSAATINLSGRQRMLSQRIVSLSAQLALGDAHVRQDLTDAIDTFAAAGARLQPNAAQPGQTSPRLKAIYSLSTPGAPSLASQMRAFVTRARHVATLPAGDDRIRAELPALAVAAREPLLAKLDAVTTEHQRISEAHGRTLRELETASIAVILLTLVAEAFAIFRPMVRRIVRANEELRRAATTDPLTGALNRRSFTDQVNNELARGARYGRPSSLLMIDADHFKAINDNQGHAAGDAVLCALSVTASLTLRPSDLLGRIGGEEFAILLAETDIAGAAAAAERVRSAIAGMRVPSDRGEVCVTVSVGVTEFLPDEFGLQSALKRADDALYVAKAQGRNRVQISAEAAIPSRASVPQTA